ncbi:helix-turn-helix domain-containing protein [Nocardia sp. CT2-14]|uniref:Helix-turn-helix domain-containing protein n=1 Tax=Nocardia aurantiaca TaxID=2675850 RepID=A0A6I3L4I5_9NOCA|nr:helix-turn-helix domain-containing protein [Nocardia aurantiaca]
MDRNELGSFLKSRRDRIRPADVGLPPGTRRRVPGLRRDEVAVLAGMSGDYYVELEQGKGARPSEQMLAVLARTLRLTDDERDYLFHLCDYAPPRTVASYRVNPRLADLLGKLDDTPALVITDLHEVLAQNALAVALLGRHELGPWPHGSFAYHWFAHPDQRGVYPADDHAYHSRVFCSDLRAAIARRGGEARDLMAGLRAISPEFARLWDNHDVEVRHSTRKRIVHPAHGVIELYCNNIPTDDGTQRLLWFSPTPNNDSARQLAALVPGTIGVLAPAELYA